MKRNIRVRSSRSVRRIVLEMRDCEIGKRKWHSLRRHLTEPPSEPGITDKCERQLWIV